MYPQYPRRQSTTRAITTATAAAVPELDPPSPLTPPIAIVGATVVDGCVKTDGEAVGASLPTSVGDSVPTTTGASVPATVGRLVGGSVKGRVGSVVGGVNGAPVGPSVPKLTGAAVCPVGARVSGASVGRREGLRVGLRVGVRVGVRVGMRVGGDVGAKDVQLKSAAPRPQLPTNSSWHEEAVGCTPQSKHLRTLDPMVPPGTHTPYWLLRQMPQENWKTTVEPPKKSVIVPLVALGITPVRVTVTLNAGIVNTDGGISTSFALKVSKSITWKATSTGPAAQMDVRYTSFQTGLSVFESVLESSPWVGPDPTWNCT